MKIYTKEKAIGDIYSYTYQTRGNSSPHGKPKIYLAGCSNKDKEYFDSVSERLLDLYNTVIWQRNYQVSIWNMEELEQMQVFIFLVTEHFLEGADAVWHKEWTYAMEHQIPILPIMIDIHVQERFNNHFGNIQCYRYLDEFMNPECDKFTDLLDVLLLDDTTRTKVLETFTRRIFLSYRKKDIAHVVSMMKAIHRCTELWDVRIWYDAYLMPGRNFDDSIRESLTDSDVMALLVTPSLLELPNYVHDPEYRIACEQSIPVLPVEMIETDTDSLKDNYTDITQPVKCDDMEEMNRWFSKYLPQKNNYISDIQNRERKTEHLYLVGLAYLYGIEVEVDHERARKYIVMAAEDGYKNAFKQLVSMYRHGIGVKKDTAIAIKWQEKYVSLLENIVKKDNANEPLIELSEYVKRYREYIREIWNLGDYYTEDFMNGAALECYKRVGIETTELMQLDKGENTFHLVSVSYAVCGDAYIRLGRITDAKDSYDKYLENAVMTYGRFKTDTAKRDLSLAYHRLGDLCKEIRNLDDAYTYYQKYAELAESVAAEAKYQERRDLWLAYKNLAEIDRENGKEDSALGLFEKAYEIAKGLAVEQRTPDSYFDLSICLDRIGMTKSSMGDIDGAFQSFKESLSIRRNLLEDTNTLGVALALCASLDYCGDCASLQFRYEEALKDYEEALEIRKNIYTEHQNIQTASYIATSLVKVGDIALKMNQVLKTKTCYEESLSIRKNNYENQSTHENRRNLAIAYQRMGNLMCRMEHYELALKYYEDNKDLCHEILGYDTSHQAKRDYKVSLVKIAESYEDINRLEEAHDQYLKYYDLCVALIDEYGYLTDYDDLAVACFNLGRFGDEKMMTKAYELFSKLADQFPADNRYRKNRDYIKDTFFS